MKTKGGDIRETPPKVHGRVPKLRFPEYIHSPEWQKKIVNDLISTIIPPAKLSTAKYLPYGKFPIVDQSREDVAGWTNDESAVIESKNSLIVFGDHTCIVKLVNEPFAQGADGMKIIEAKREIDTGFLYHVISFFSPQSNEYKRHFSELIEVAFYRPELLEEQQKTAACLSSLDKLITAFTEKLESLKVYKKGLMQSLFPAEGEAVPRLRFPEFRDSGEWGRNTISSLLIKASTPVEVKPNQMYQEIGIRSHGKGIFHKEPIRGEELGSKRVFWVEANSFVVNIVFAWEQAVATTSNKEKGMIASHRFPMYKARAKKCDVNFIKHFFLTKKGKELLGIASPGGAGRNKTLGQTDFNNITILTPEDVGEQKKISDTLTAFDELIAAQTKQIEVLKEHKLGLMQGLFPVAEDSD